MLIFILIFEKCCTRYDTNIKATYLYISMQQYLEISLK